MVFLTIFLVTFYHILLLVAIFFLEFASVPELHYVNRILKIQQLNAFHTAIKTNLVLERMNGAYIQLLFA